VGRFDVDDDERGPAHPNSEAAVAVVRGHRARARRASVIRRNDDVEEAANRPF